MLPLGPAQQALSPDQIVQQFPTAIDEMIAATKEPSQEYERLVQLRKARYQWRMVKGDQFIAPGFTADWAGSEIVDYVTVDSFPSEDETGAQVAFAYPINVLGGDLWKFVAVMGQSAPRVKAVADDAESTDDTQKAKDADAILRDLWNKWKADQQQRNLAFHQYVTGPIFGYTPWVVDRLKYGSTTQPQIGIDQQAQPDGSSIPVPSQGEPQSYDNGDVELHLATVLMVTIPFGAKSLEECGYLNYEYMEDRFKLLATFPELESYRETDPPDEDFDSSSVSAAEAVDSVSNPSGQARPKKTNQWRYRRLWLQPYLYEAIKDANARQIFKTQFPDGVRIVRVGSFTIPSQLKNEKLTDVWAVCRTGRGEKILEAALCEDSVPIQRCLNDLGNLAIETVLRSIAQTVVDQLLLDRQAVNTKEALPAEILFSTTPGMGDISKMIAQIPPARVSDQLVPLFQLLRTLQQDITGIRPELSGGGVPTQTYREAKQRKDQALMQLSPQSQEMQAFWEQVGANGVKQRARYGTGTVKVQQKSAFGTRTNVVDLASLSETGWHTEADDGIPMSFTDQSDRLYSLLKEYTPEVVAALGINDPINLDANLELLQLPDHESPNAVQKKKTISDIQALLQGQPIDGPPGPDGQSGPPQPSIPVDSYDDHQFVALFTARWLVSENGQDQKQQNPQGFQNVLAWWQQQQQQAQPPQPPPPPAVKASLTVNAKAEDMGPDFVNEVLQGANLPALPAPAIPQAMPPAPAGQRQPGAETPESPLPPMPGGVSKPTGPGPMGPAPPTIQ